MNYNDMITIYYYTAWDGFAWQGCDEATAKSLQGYMEATKTLPKSSAEEPPFGGVVPCKIAGHVGVAVYRYHTRLKGDLSGRDSLYIALAFVPLSTGCVDFSRLLELPQLAETKSGALVPEEVSASEKGLRLPSIDDVPNDWLDKDIDGTEYCVLKGREGLLTLSRLFFSKYTQLGFLNAVFRSKSGVDGIVSAQTYRVYPEVARVAAASETLNAARKHANGLLSSEDSAFVGMKSALGELAKWALKQPGYPGLREYYDAKCREQNDDAERLAEIKRYLAALRRLSDEFPNMKAPGEGDLSEGELIKWLSPDIGNGIKRCEQQVKGIEKLPVLDDASYRDAVALSMREIQRAAYLGGLQRGIELVLKVEHDRKSLKAELEQKKTRIYDLEHDVSAQSEQISKLSKEKKKIEEALSKEKSKHHGKGDDEGAKKTTKLPPLVFRPTDDHGTSWWMVGMGCALAIVIAVCLIVLGILFFMSGKKPNHNPLGEQPKSEVVTDVGNDAGGNLATNMLPNAHATNRCDGKTSECPGASSTPANTNNNAQAVQTVLNDIPKKDVEKDKDSGSAKDDKDKVKSDDGKTKDGSAKDDKDKVKNDDGKTKGGKEAAK